MTNKSAATVKLGSEHLVTADALLTNAVGLHARPSVKLTQLAKSFVSRIEIALHADGPWVDAKSPVKIMRVKAPKGTILRIRAQGDDADVAVAAIKDLVDRQFDEAGEVGHG